MAEILNNVVQTTDNYNRDVKINIAYPLFGESTIYTLNVNPTQLNITAGGNLQQSEIINLGSIVRLKKGQLHQVNWSGFFPFTDYHPYVTTRADDVNYRGSFISQEEWVHLFERMRDEMKPCRLIVTGLGINMMAALSDFQWSYSGGNQDVNYSLSFIEYVPYDLMTSEIAQTVTEDTVEAVENAVQPTNFCVGATVDASGTYYCTSYGEEPHGSCSGVTGTINHINEDGTHPYHVCNADGDLGWFTKDCVALK